MRIIILILFAVLCAGYVINHHVLTDWNARWYCYFVVNDMKAFIISLALCAVTRRKPEFIFAVCALLICTYDVLTQVFDVNVKGDWPAVVYQLLVGLTFVFIIWQMKKLAGSKP